MVTLPKEFVALPQPGYFWNLNDQKLYSCKVTGMLKPLKISSLGLWHNGRWNADRTVPGYWMSEKKKRKFISLVDLKKLRTAKSVFPVHPVV